MIYLTFFVTTEFPYFHLCAFQSFDDFEKVEKYIKSIFILQYIKKQAKMDIITYKLTANRDIWSLKTHGWTSILQNPGRKWEWMVGLGTRTGRRTAWERREETWSTPTATSWHTQNTKHTQHSHSDSNFNISLLHKHFIGPLKKKKDIDKSYIIINLIITMVDMQNPCLKSTYSEINKIRHLIISRQDRKQIFDLVNVCLRYTSPEYSYYLTREMSVT